MSPGVSWRLLESLGLRAKKIPLIPSHIRVREGAWGNPQGQMPGLFPHRHILRPLHNGLFALLEWFTLEIVA